jgi:hypothetical protein
VAAKPARPGLAKLFAPPLKKQVSKRPLFEKSGTKNFFDFGPAAAKAARPKLTKIFAPLF